MKTEKKNFYIGSFLLTLGVLFLTVIPTLVDILDLNIIIDKYEVDTFALLTFVIGGILYMTDLSYFKKQIIWLLFLMLFFIGFQFAFVFFRHLIY